MLIFDFIRVIMYIIFIAYTIFFFSDLKGTVIGFIISNNVHYLSVLAVAVIFFTYLLYPYRLLMQIVITHVNPICSMYNSPHIPWTGSAIAKLTVNNSNISAQLINMHNYAYS